MNIRLGGHRAASKTKPNLPIYKHFLTLPNHNLEKDIKITILEKTTTDQTSHHKRKSLDNPHGDCTPKDLTADLNRSSHSCFLSKYSMSNTPTVLLYKLN